ncbi:hypothetical protein J6590_054097 [Homalodisca vitripennis]|nr:hypothetical protein J6590_054097 [Homalodisca vitripennis]
MDQEVQITCAVLYRPVKGDALIQSTLQRTQSHSSSGGNPILATKVYNREPSFTGFHKAGLNHTKRCSEKSSTCPSEEEIILNPTMKGKCVVTLRTTIDYRTKESSQTVSAYGRLSHAADLDSDKNSRQARDSTMKWRKL